MPEIVDEKANFAKQFARRRIKQSLQERSKIANDLNWLAPRYAAEIAESIQGLIELAERTNSILPPEILTLLDPLGLYEASKNDPELKARIPDIFERNAAYLIRTVLRHLSGKSLYRDPNKYFETVETSNGTYRVPISMGEEQIRKEQRNRLAIV